jgi:hypothetical protein
VVDIQLIKQEQIVFLRNQDIFTKVQRGVNTTTATGNLSGETTITIDKTNVKNIRSITVAAVSKSYGSEYSVDYNNNLGCVITFGEEQTGAYIVTYDFGNDKIYPDFPRDDLTITSYPRMAMDLLNVSTEAFGIGGSKFISNVAFTVVVYADNSDDLDGYIQTIREKYITNAKSFYYLKFIKPTMIGPTINSPDRSDEIMQKNLDLLGMFEVDSL